MARKKTEKVISSSKEQPTEDFTADLINSLNKDLGHRVAYNLSSDQSPTHVKRWISTGSRQLDYIISNRANGGLPEGRIVEIFGPPSIGKSHIASHIAKSTQHMGGIVVYIDTENATSVENLQALGINISKRFVYADTHCTEEVFEIAEKTIMKAKSLSKDIPITIIWDSVAATSPKAELDGAYDKDTIGLQARVISKGMRKITGVIGDQNVLFVCLNQIRMKIGVMFGDPSTTPGGNAIPFHSSVRIKLGAGSQIKEGKDDVIGINVSAKTIKNKVGPPFRKVNFRVIFGKGIEEHEEIFDHLRAHGPEMIDGHEVCAEGTAAWKTFYVKKGNEEIITKKFTKKNFDELFDDSEILPWLEKLMDKAYTRIAVIQDDMDVDENSYEEIKALANEVGDDLQLDVPPE